MAGNGIDLVLRGLAHVGSDARRAGDDVWEARCPVHGGPYNALLVTRGQNGSVSLNCRYRDHKGTFCAESELWESIGLDPREFAGGQVAIAPPERPNESCGQSSPATNGHADAPCRDAPSHEPIDPVSAGESAEISSVSGADQPACAEDVAEQVPESAAAPDSAAALASDLSPSHLAVAVSPEPLAHGEVASPDHLARKDGSHAEMLMRIAGKVRIFRGSDSRFYAQVPVRGHQAVYELRSPSFERWLTRTFRQDRRAVPTLESVNRLVRALEADAEGLGSTERVWIRVAAGGGPTAAQADPAHDGAEPIAAADCGPAYYLDLGDSSRVAVEIRPGGCRIVTGPPVLFWRPKGLRALPEPRWDGSINELKQYTNVTDADFPLLVAWMTAALRPVGPYPILVLSGEQGSAKTTTARVARRLIDPNAALLRALPASQRDFMIEAHNSWVLGYDNLSSIPASLSDSFCRVATGGGFSTRSLHSNDEETLFDVERPMILNGIDEIVGRGDLIDRCIFLHLPTISDKRRRLESAFWLDFEAASPRLLGALLTALSGGLSMLPRVNLPSLPRMADFAQWGEAVGLSLGWQPGTFLGEYHANRRAACVAELEDCPVALALRRMMDGARGIYRGTASMLLEGLGSMTPAEITRSAQWPKTPRLFARILRRIAPQLRLIGIDVRFDRGRNARLITISGVADFERRADDEA